MTLPLWVIYAILGVAFGMIGTAVGLTIYDIVRRWRQRVWENRRGGDITEALTRRIGR